MFTLIYTYGPRVNTSLIATFVWVQDGSEESILYKYIALNIIFSYKPERTKQYKERMNEQSNTKAIQQHDKMSAYKLRNI